MSTTTEIPAIAQTALAVFEEPKAMISACKTYCDLTVEKDGITKVTECRVKVKKLRVSIDKRREEQNAAALEHQRTVNAFAKSLIAEVRQIEDYLAGEEAAHESAKEAARQAKEAERLAALQIRINRLTAAGALDICVHEFEGLSPDAFELYVSEASEMARVRAEEDERESARVAAAEAEARLQAESERTERDRLEKERAIEMARQAEELRIRNAEVERERRELEAEKAELRRQQQEIQFQQEAERRAAEAAERQRRLEALKPEIERAETFRALMARHTDEVLESLGNPEWGDKALDAIDYACMSIIDHVKGS